MIITLISKIIDNNDNNNKKITSKFIRIQKNNIIDSIELNKNYNFDKNTYLYT